MTETPHVPLSEALLAPASDQTLPSRLDASPCRIGGENGWHSYSLSMRHPPLGLPSTVPIKNMRSDHAEHII